MKKLALMMLLICGSAFADNTYTTNAGIPKPADSDTGWGETIRDAFDIIDSSFATLSGTQTFTGSPTISSATITTLRSDKIIISTPSYSGSEKLSVNGAVKFFGPTGAVTSYCDQNGTNCSNISAASNPYYGVSVDTISVHKIEFINSSKSPQTSIFIGNGTGNLYVGSSGTRPDTAIGANALGNFDGTYLYGGIGGGNVGVGYSAGSSLERGRQNLFAGDGAGAYLTDGNYNVFLGYGSGSGAGNADSVVVSNDSIYIGQYTGQTSSSTVLSNASAIGAYALVNSSNSIVLGPYVGFGSGTPYNLGIGTDTPRAVIHAIHDQTKTDSYSLIISTVGSNKDLYNLAVSTDGAVGITPLTAAAIRAVVPRRVGQYFYCTDCATVSTCVSTGTAVNQWALITNKGSACN